MQRTYAMQRYPRFSKAVADTETELLFTQLANIERSHKIILEDIYTNMTFPEFW